MKCDRRWWNDGRLDRVCRAYSERSYESPHQIVYGLTPRPVDPEAERVKAEIDEYMARWMYERIADVFGVVKPPRVEDD